MKKITIYSLLTLLAMSLFASSVQATEVIQTYHPYGDLTYRWVGITQTEMSSDLSSSNISSTYEYGTSISRSRKRIGGIDYVWNIDYIRAAVFVYRNVNGSWELLKDSGSTQYNTNGVMVTCKWGGSGSNAANLYDDKVNGKQTFRQGSITKVIDNTIDGWI